MKLRLLALLLLTTTVLFSQNFHDTQGKLDVSSGGQVVYTLPVAMPPSLKGMGPTINLVYSSGQLGGVAGQGWNISTISAISRISTRKDLDGFIDGVDFDDNDKLAFEGQRLMLKTGTYWADGSTYETEVQSNVKIELKGIGNTMYFIVTTPDGSRTWYGNYAGINATDNLAYYIVRTEDINGNFVNYYYTDFNSTLCIDTIKFSANINGITPLNTIKFNYQLPKRQENAFVKGVKIFKNAQIKNIQVFTNNQLFREYRMTYASEVSLAYERLVKIQEFNGSLEPANPIEFEYENTTTDIYKSEFKSTYYNNVNLNDIDISGDFDGDGRLDFVSNNFVYSNLFNAGGTGTPLQLPFFTGKRTKFSATTIVNNKLSQQQSVVHAKENANSIEFKVYNLQNGAFANSQSKTISIQNTASIGTVTLGHIALLNGWPDLEFCEPFDGIKKATNYLEGDFNGDGISEILMYHKNTEVQNYHTDSYHEIPSDDFRSAKCTVTFSNHDADVNHYLIDLNPNSGTTLNSDGYIKFNNTLLGNFTDKKFIADYNGDGKSDILVIKQNKTYKIIGFKQLTTAPWVELEVLGEGIMEDYSTTKQILFGDFNGDNKADIMLPHYDNGGCFECVQWHIYYSNPNPAGGSFFTKETHNIVDYRPDTGTYFDTQRHLSNYYALDTNGDGKSDLVRIWRNYYKPRNTINDHNTQWQITTYANNIGNTNVIGNKFTLNYISPCVFVPAVPGYIDATFNCNHDSDSNELPAPIVSNYRNKGLNNEIVMIRSKYAEMTYVDFQKDIAKEAMLKKVISSGGVVTDEVTYKTLEPSTANNGQGNLDEFYSSTNTLTYPNVEIKRVPTATLVSKITNTVNGVIKHQDFKYCGYILNLNGLGALGFNKTARSAWYASDTSKRIWNVSEYDATKRGAITRTYSELVQNGSAFSFVLSGNPSGIMSSTTSIFNSFTQNGIYHLLLDSQINQDFLTGISNETSYTYDNQYFIPTTIISKNKLNGIEQGKTTSTTTFESNTSGIGSDYYIGRPNTTKSIVEAYGTTAESTSEMYYTSGNVTKTKKKGNTTEAKYSVEEFQYNVFGNVIKSTSSTEGYTGLVLAPSSIEYTYDATQRFVKTVKDNQGLVSTNDTYHPKYGIVTSVTNPYGQTATSQIDNWGKTIKTTNYLGKSGYTAYTKNGNEYTVTNTADDGSSSITISNALGMLIKKGQKNIDATWSYVNYEYDYLGRKTRESEPYSSGSPTLWNTETYDDYSRIINNTRCTGLVTNITYSGTTVTGTDNFKTVSSTKNANGHLISSTDPGGTINFTYNADGNLRNSNFDGTIIAMEYNEWGNKTKLTDPSAGLYEYSYYPSGQIRTEKTPKGITTNTLDPINGNLLEKTIVGDLTNSKSTYTYDGVTKLPLNTLFTNTFDGTIINYTNEYDTAKRIIKTTESNVATATFQHEMTYDDFGRPLLQTYKAVNHVNGKQSVKTVKNTYKNGAPWQILDNTNQAVLWQTNTVNGRGQLTSANLGPLMVANTYNDFGLATGVSHKYLDDDRLGIIAELMKLTYVFEPLRGNLTSRTNHMFVMDVPIGSIQPLPKPYGENFTYDNLDRLLTDSYATPVAFVSPKAGGTFPAPTSPQYDNKGRITRTGIGTYNYTNSAKQYQNTSVTLNTVPLNYYQNNAIQNVTYNGFKSPVTIDVDNIDKLSFTYNIINGRSSMYYGSLETDKLQRKMHKHYSADGTMEIKYNKLTGETEFLTYIGGDGYSAPMVLKSNGITQEYLYLHRDYQGSIMAISNDSGQVLEKRLFDAWGNIVKVQNGAGVDLGKLTLLDRGYTGHEHLQSVGLIHMNGRLYDPKLHRFLQPDNYVQDPYNTQNYNRYAYVLNNPLKYTDPSGEEFVLLTAVIIGAVVSAATYTLTALLADVPFTVGGILQATFIGAASGAVTFGIGEYAKSAITSFWLRTGFQALAHGTFQGGMTAAQGGEFWTGFASGSLASLASSLWQGGATSDATHTVGSHTATFGNQTVKGIGGEFGSKTVGILLFGTLAGGAGAELSGGNFWQGAVTGLIVSG
ncbi:RHS repeat-associated core domain-containing protein, partial [Flavobacterium sp.]|uniref:RHS repeat-associated core domain-containing protein n=1 Tax=Flavobacterium sp. TaxID=239 RepID=UPI00286D8333